MRIIDRRADWSWVRRAMVVLSLALLVSACGTSGSRRTAQVETRDENGFTISERVRVSAGVRGDFEDAMQMLEQEDYEAAIALLEEVTKEAPQVVAPHVDLGIAYERVSDLESAENSMKRALELNPRHPVAHNELGIVYRRMGRFEDARASYENALAGYPRFHFARRNLAILCDLYLADMACAMENYELYIQAVPDDESVAMWIADLRNRMGN